MFFYSDGPREPFTGSIARMDANKAYMGHYDNSMYLEFMAANGTMVERHQAEKELVICEGKMKFWERQDNFDYKVVKPLKEKATSNWRGK